MSEWRSPYDPGMTIASLLPKTTTLLHDGIDRGHHFGGQLAIIRDGEVILDDAFGTLGPGTDEPLRPDHILCWRSAGKPATAIALLQIVEEQPSILDRKVDSWFADELAELPGDAALVEAPPTVRQLLTHTTGWQLTETGWPDVDVAASLDRVLRAPLREGARPGEVAAYDPQAAWLLLGEIVFRETGLEIADAVQSRVFDVLGIDAAMKYGPSRIASLEDRLAPQFDTNRGQNLLLPLTTTGALTTAAPGSSCRGPIAALAQLYAALLDDLNGQGSSRLLSQGMVQTMISRHRENMLDQTFQRELDFGLGVIVNSNRYGADKAPYSFGRHTGEAAFGHGGAQCAIGFADPEHNLAVAWVLNGLPGEPRHDKRNREINTAIYEDLGLAT